MNANVLGAVFRRNFSAYFANPTGYVFICVFVLLSGLAAFWPPEFFNANLANLDQLNLYFPYIMLVFIPAITMSVWSDERRQGTDELLLTIPGNDSDIVLGKYLAALGVFTVSLLFSLVCNLLVLWTLGDPDPGLFLGTYFGYWMIGLAMLAVGIVASFLVGNLTVAYIVGALFNACLIFPIYADTVLPRRVATLIKDFTIGERFRDFGHGVISLTGIVYFGMVAAVMLYLCMILIGRRHWLSGPAGGGRMLHFVVRTLSLAFVAWGLTYFLENHDRCRADVTTEKLSSLSSDTIKLLNNLDAKRPVLIEAFISPSVPEMYVQQRLNLRNMLREIQARGGTKVQVTVTDTEPFTAEAARAEKRYNIAPRTLNLQTQGRFTRETVFMGVALSCGLQKVTLPFIDKGIPVEYELVRSICTVTQQKRKRIGILQTDAQLYGQFNMQTMSPGSNWPIIDELEKQYDVVQVDPTNPITEKYDVLLAVQPSSLGPEQMENFIKVVEHGQPTAIFEDPLPIFAHDVPATSAPRQSPQMNPMMGMMGGGQRDRPKGDISRLWRMLGVDVAPEQIVWQRYNPYPKIDDFNRQPEFVFVDRGENGENAKADPFNPKSNISAGLQQLLFPFPGAIMRLQASNLEFIPLVKTGDKSTGTVAFNEVMQSNPFGMRMGFNERRQQVQTNSDYVLAAQIKGKIHPAEFMAADKAPAADKAAAQTAPAQKTAAVKPAGEKPVPAKTEPAAKSEPAAKVEASAKEVPPAETKPAETEINIVLVADIDMLTEPFFRLREQGEMPEINFDFDNVTFVLNTLDVLAGDDRFVEIRKRRPQHRTLSTIEIKTEDATRQAAEGRKRFIDKCAATIDTENKALQAKLDELRKRKGANQMEIMQELEIAQETGQQRVEAAKQQAERERDQEVNKIETDLRLQVQKVQSWYKTWAVLLPPIPPLLIGLGVWLTRRAREREGVSRARLRG